MEDESRDLSFVKGTLTFARGAGGGGHNKYTSQAFQILVCQEDGVTYILNPELHLILQRFDNIKVVIVYGRVGSGKSSFINLIIGKTVFVAGYNTNRGQTKGIQACLVLNSPDDDMPTLFMDCEGVGSSDERDKLILLIASFTRSIFIYNIRNKFEASTKELTDDMKIVTLISKELTARQKRYQSSVKKLNILLRDFNNNNNGETFNEIFLEQVIKNKDLKELNDSVEIVCHSLPIPCQSQTNMDLQSNYNALNRDFKDSIVKLDVTIREQLRSVDPISVSDLTELWKNLFEYKNDSESIIKTNGLALQRKEFIKSQKKKLLKQYNLEAKELVLPVGSHVLNDLKKKSLENARELFTSIEEPTEFVVYSVSLHKEHQTTALKNLECYVSVGVSRISTLINQLEICHLDDLKATWDKFSKKSEDDLGPSFESLDRYRKFFNKLTDLVYPKLEESFLLNFTKVIQTNAGLQALTNAKLKSVFNLQIEPLNLPTRPNTIPEVTFDKSTVKGRSIEHIIIKKSRFLQSSKRNPAYHVKDEYGNVIETTMGSPSEQKIKEVNEYLQKKIDEKQQIVDLQNEKIKRTNEEKLNAYNKETEDRINKHEVDQRIAQSVEFAGEIANSYISRVRSQAIFLVVNKPLNTITTSDITTLLFDKSAITDMASGYVIPRVLKYVGRVVEVSLISTGNIPLYIVIKVSSFLIQALLSTLVSMAKSKIHDKESDKPVVSFKQQFLSSMSYGALSQVVSNLASSFIPFSWVVDCVVDLSQAFTYRIGLEQRLISIVSKKRKEDNITDTPGDDDGNESIQNKINELSPQELYTERKIIYNLKDIKWMNPKYESNTHCLAYTLFKRGIVSQDYTLDDKLMKEFKKGLVDWVNENSTTEVDDGEGSVMLKQRFPDLDEQNESFLKPLSFASPLYLWALSKKYNTEIFEIQSIPQIEVLNYGKLDSVDPSRTIFYGNLENNFYPLELNLEGKQSDMGNKDHNDEEERDIEDKYQETRITSTDDTETATITTISSPTSISTSSSTTAHTNAYQKLVIDLETQIARTNKQLDDYTSYMNSRHHSEMEEEKLKTFIEEVGRMNRSFISNRKKLSDCLLDDDNSSKTMKMIDDIIERTATLLFQIDEVLSQIEDENEFDPHIDTTYL
eukprot:TRINITY_DN5554_c0_g1_i1.p1 TRINITY_DN5554_c0_g1~~TRINITY_DN5554_c0_g1_i1.p1  ORF type:complete len:1143 (+),score=228.01 TRINITY_DN5554_c0_g1_i1:38-3466(+)